MSSRVPSAARTLRVLRYLASRTSPASLEGIARSCSLPRSTAYHLLNTMIAEGFVEHFPDLHRFGLGVRAHEIGTGWSLQDPVQRLARVPLAGLVDRVGVSAVLAVRRQREIVLVQEDRAPEMPPLLVGEGRAPARSTVSGLVMLATLTPAALRALYPEPAAFVDRSRDGPTDLGSLRTLLQQVRRLGHAREDRPPAPRAGQCRRCRRRRRRQGARAGRSGPRAPDDRGHRRRGRPRRGRPAGRPGDRRAPRRGVRRALTLPKPVPRA